MPDSNLDRPELSFFADMYLDYSPKLEERLNWRKLTTFIPNKTLPIHNWFYCPQAFSARLVDLLIDALSVPREGKVLDPFCGIGTTLLVCKQRNIPSIGCDIFPLFYFVSKVKLEHDYDFDKLEGNIKSIIGSRYEEPSLDIPKHPIFKRAFSEKTLNEILFFKEKILAIEDEKIRDFFLLGLLSIINEVSYVRKAGAHYRFINVDRIGVRHQYKNLKLSQPDVRKTLKQKLQMMCSDVKSQRATLVFYSPKTKANRNQAEQEATIADARKMSFLTEASVDAVITSPPYPNRDNYVAQYKLELFLAEPPYGVQEFSEYRDITFRTLRSHVEAKEQPKLKTEVRMEELDALLQELYKRQLSYRTIPEMVKGYFEDMAKAFSEFYRVLKTNGKMAVVIGNVRFGGVTIPVDFMLCRIAEEEGFSIEKIIVARYKMNSPQQMKRYGKVPVRESIILLQK